MNRRTPVREVLIGLVIVATLGSLLGLLGVAGSGPSFLTSRRTIDVLFRDGQGIRVGSPVRVAGIDAGRVVDLDLTEIGRDAARGSRSRSPPSWPRNSGRT